MAYFTYTLLANRKIMEFEYKIDTCWGEDDEHQEYLNRMGKDRWELVFAKSDGGTFITYTFKRRKE